MSYLDDLLGKEIQINGTVLPMRKILNFLSGVTGVDNPSNGSTDLTVTGGGGSGDTPYSGSNPNAGGDALPGTRGAFLRNTGAWNGYDGWSCITTGTPGVWVPVGRGGQITSKSVSYQILPTDLRLRVTSTASVLTMTLPDTTIIPAGFDVPIIDASGSNTGNDTVITGHLGTEVIGVGAATSDSIIADGNGNSKTYVWTGARWDIYF